MGGVLVVSGAAGSGKTVLAEAAANEARCRGFEVLWASCPEVQPGYRAWAQLLCDADAPAGLVEAISAENASPLCLDEAAVQFVSGSLRLIVVDDVDRGGPDAVGCCRCSPRVVRPLRWR